MTTESAAVLMNKYFDNEATDTELAALFLHLGASEESRLLFADMKAVEDSLVQAPAIDYPAEIDERMSALEMREKNQPFMKRKISVTMATAVLSAFVVCLVSMVFLAMVSRSDGYQERYERQSAMNSMYSHGAVSHQSNEN